MANLLQATFIALSTLSTFILAYGVPSLNPLQSRDDTGSSTLPKCFYNYPCATQCTGTPNFANCQQSINAVCATLATNQANGQQWLVYRTETPPDPDGPPPPNDDSCEALIRLSGNQQPTTAQACIQIFQTLQGCAQSTNMGYNASCAGGSQNLQYCNGKQGFLVDDTLPGYVLGNPDMVHVMPATTHLTTDVNQGSADVVSVEDTTPVGPLTQQELNALTSTSP